MRVCPQCRSVFQEDGIYCPHDRTPLLPCRPDDARCGTFIDGRYVVLARLGRGGMGTVYRAWQLSTAREVALKLLADAVKDQPVALERFLREARVTAGLRCPHTVRVFDFGQLQDGTPYLAMELVEGLTLDALLASTGALPPPRALELVRQICLALEEAHGQGLVHRDLKPSNIMVSPMADGGDFARVLDFGVAKVIDGDTTALTAENNSPGTPAYMAPEQARSEPVGPPADLYAVAVMLYEMLTGERPFTGTSAVAVLVQHAQVPPPRLVEKRPTLPGVAALDAVLQRGLAKLPTDRYATAAALRDDLDRVKAGQQPEGLGLAATAEAASMPGLPGKKRMLGLNFHALGCSVQLAIAVGALALFILPTWRSAEEGEAPSPLEEAVEGRVHRAAEPGAVAAASVAPASAPVSAPVSAPASVPAEPTPDRRPVPAVEVMPQPMLPADLPIERPSPDVADQPTADGPAVQRPGLPRPKMGARARPADKEKDEERESDEDDRPRPPPPPLATVAPATAAPGAPPGGDSEPSRGALIGGVPSDAPDRIGPLRALLKAACGPEVRGRFRVTIDPEGRASVATDEPACVRRVVAVWRPGPPAEVLEVELP